MQFCCENVQARPSVYVQAAEFLKINPKQADEIRKKFPISEGGVERENYVI